MKKLLCVLLAVLLLPALALADNEITFDESTIANLEGEFTALEDFGLMFYLPAVLQAQEVTDEMAQQGVYAQFANADDTCRMNIGYAPAVDGNGAAIEDVNGLAEFFRASGLTDAEVGSINGLPCVAWSDDSNALMGIAYVTEAGNQLAFNFYPTTNEEFKNMAYVIISSVMELQYAE